MGARPVATSATASLSWRINARYAAQTQGLVVSGFTHLPWAEALFLRFDASGGSWLKTLQITDATGKPADRAAAIAFTWTGLKTLGLDDETWQRSRFHFAKACSRRTGCADWVTGRMATGTRR